MSEIAAKSKFACPSCGGEAVWNAGKRALVCAFCGTVAPMELPVEGGEGIVEHDLVRALQGIGADGRGWAAEKRSVKCQSCQAVTVFDPVHVAQKCDFCGSAALVPFEEMGAPIRPESLLEFRMTAVEVRDRVKVWYGSRWFAPSGFKSRALTDTLRGIYLPYWTFDAEVLAEWTAESGYYYWETESYEDSNGRRQTRQVQRTRWENSAGSVRHFFDDELVPGSKGVAAELLRKIEPFPTRTDLKPYDPGYVSGWVVEQYQIDLVGAAGNARAVMEGKMVGLCAAEVPGDTQRGLRVNSDYSGQTFKHLLVPVWVLAYTYGSGSFQVIVNGYTGAIAGKHPLSWGKIFLVGLVGLVVLTMILYVASKQNS